ncbi:MAG: FHA domain-containing protein [Rhizonema sp. PD38]|nr:FHA domain-containing protein [Rhizonema sp. PD38]
MIVCPNCNHPNPDGAVQCEACYTPLPATTNCPSCGATVQADAAFCGQCGYNLRSTTASSNLGATVAPDPLEVPPLVTPDTLVEAPQTVTSGSAHIPTPEPIPDPTPEPIPLPTAVLVPAQQLEEQSQSSSPPTVAAQTLIEEPEAPPPQAAAAPTVARTQLQHVTGGLVHVQTDRLIELPQNLSVIHIGKPNDRIPPDVDVSGFPDSEIVSRIHSDIRIEGDAYYIEDVGSSNGTYINNLPLLPGNRHRLRPGDRISLGKGDLVTFVFQLS